MMTGFVALPKITDVVGMPFVDVGTPVFPPSPTLTGRSWLVDLSLCDGTQIAMAGTYDCSTHARLVCLAFVQTRLFF